MPEPRAAFEDLAFRMTIRRMKQLPDLRSRPFEEAVVGSLLCDREWQDFSESEIRRVVYCEGSTST